MGKNKLWYYTRNILVRLLPKTWYEKALPRKLASIHHFNQVVLRDRVNYYNKLEALTPPGPKARALKNVTMWERPKAYNFDAFQYTRYFSRAFKVNFIFGDVVHTEAFPTIQKSRPLNTANTNAVLLNLNKKRHFVFVNDTKKFTDKKNKLIGRNVIKQAHRIRFMNLYFDQPFCDLGQINKEGGNIKWLKPKISIAAHLDFKFILSLEGNDVATNLKWIMSSNSIAVMPKPKHETWFMEGRLVPDFHYILIKDDYSDLEEKINYYIQNEAAAQAIIANAHQHVRQFLNKKQEDMISLLVLQKYFYYTGQATTYELL